MIHLFTFITQYLILIHQFVFPFLDFIIKQPIFLSIIILIQLFHRITIISLYLSIIFQYLINLYVTYFIHFLLLYLILIIFILLMILLINLKYLIKL